MRADAIVVGTGLAGLTAAVRLAEGGAKVLLLAKGIGATHLAAGTIDVLGYDPDRVASPAEALPRLIAARPGHPYATLGIDAVAEALEWLSLQVPSYQGSPAENLLLPTTVGAAKPTCLAPETMRAGDLRRPEPMCIVGFRRLRDLHPALVADNVPVDARSVELELPAGERADENAQGIARMLDDPKVRGLLAGQLAGRLRNDERVGFPAVLGLREPHAVWADLEHRLGRPVFEIPTLPPSVPGMRLYTTLRAAFRHAGGRQIIGPEVIAGITEGGRLTGVRVRIGRRDAVHHAESFVLATGGFGSGGLAMDSSWAVRETALGLPVSPLPDGPRFVPGYFDEQPMARAGIAVDAELRPVGPDGAPVYENVRVAGATLAGAVPWKEGSGDGISLTSGHRAAGLILGESSAAPSGVGAAGPAGREGVA